MSPEQRRQQIAGIVAACLMPWLDEVHEAGPLMLTCRSAHHHISCAKSLVGKLLRKTTSGAHSAGTARRVPHPCAPWLLAHAAASEDSAMSVADVALAAVWGACSRRDVPMAAAVLAVFEPKNRQSSVPDAVSQLVVNARDIDGFFLWQQVIMKAHPANCQLLSLLFRAGASVRLTPTLLVDHMAMLVDQPEVLHLLLEHGAFASCIGEARQPWAGYQPLHNAVRQLLGRREDMPPGMAYLTSPARPIRSMQEACAHARNICRMLTEHGADVDAVCKGDGCEGNTPLHMACQMLQLPWVRALIACGARVDATHKQSGYCAIHYVILQPGILSTAEDQKALQTQVLKAVLDAGADVDAARSSDKATALHIACNLRQPHTVQLLLERGASVNAKAVNGITPLYQAAVSACSASVKLLLARGAKVTQGPSNGVNLLLNIVANTNPAAWTTEADEVVEMLLAAGLPVDASDAQGCTPLQLAAGLGHLPIVRVLLRRRASLGLAGGAKTALHHAVFCMIACEESGNNSMLPPGPHLDVMQALLHAGANVNAQSNPHADVGGMPLHLACMVGHAAAVRMLIKHGANVMARTPSGDTPLLVICGSSRAADGEDACQIVHELVEATPACLHSRSKGGMTPLGAAVQCMKHGIVEELLRLGARVNEQVGVRTAAPLHIACQDVHRTSHAIGLRIAEGGGAQLGAIGSFKEPSASDVLAMVELLLANGADVNLVSIVPSSGPNRPTLGYTPLHCAISSGYTDVAAALVAAGAEPGTRCGLGAQQPTPLHLAIMKSQAASLRVLLAHPDVYVHAVDVQFGSLLHLACWWATPDCIKVLLEAGADPRVSWQWFTPLQLVAQRKQPPVKLVQLLGAPQPCSQETLRNMLTLLVQALADWNSRSISSMQGGSDIHNAPTGTESRSAAAPAASPQGSGTSGDAAACSGPSSAPADGAQSAPSEACAQAAAAAALEATAPAAGQADETAGGSSVAVTHGSGPDAQGGQVAQPASDAGRTGKVCSHCGAAAGSSRPMPAAGEVAAGTSAGSSRQVWSKLKLCSRCASVRYCSEECQLAGWEGGHKKECKRLLAAKAAQV